MSAGNYSDFLRALGQNESGNNYSFVSSVGYLGRYQFGEEALQAIGFYAGDSTWGIDFVGGWTAKAHQYGVYDKAGFLASPAAQDAAMEAWVAKIHADLAALDLLKYDGQWVAGAQVTMSGLLAGAHLVGVWQLKDYLASNGSIVARDPYGTPVSEYVQKFGGYQTPFSGQTAGETSGGAGSEWLQGARLFGWSGDDTLVASGSDTYLRGGDGNDQINGAWGFDDLQGNAGDDLLKGAGGDDWVVGGKDQDRLFGEDGADVVLGNMGHDTVDGGEGADVVRGGQDNDHVAGAGGDDWLSGDRGNDTLTGGWGADTFHFFDGAGSDRVTDFDYAAGDRVDLLPGTTWSASQQGADTVLVTGAGDQLVLQGVQLWSLPSDWIV